MQMGPERLDIIEKQAKRQENDLRGVSELWTAKHQPCGRTAAMKLSPPPEYTCIAPAELMWFNNNVLAEGLLLTSISFSSKLPGPCDRRVRHQTVLFNLSFLLLQRSCGAARASHVAQ